MSKKEYANEFHRRDMVAKWKTSGLSQAAFCRQEGIPEWALSNWKRREATTSGAGLKPKQRKGPKRSRVQTSIEFASAKNAQQESAPAQAATFVPLRAANEETAARDILREVRRTPVAEICFGEVSVRIWRGADKETVSAVLDALKEYYTC